jgi:hypothetical protein
LARWALPHVLATKDPSATLSSSTAFPGSPVIRPPLLRRFRGGRRRASPVAWRVLVTVLPLPPRRRTLPCQPGYDMVCCLRLSGCRLGLRGFAFSGPPLRSLTLRPGDSPSSCDDVVDELQVMGFPPPCHLATGLLALTLAGLAPAEHASLCWTHNRTGGFHRITAFPWSEDSSDPRAPRGGRADRAFPEHPPDGT